MPVIKKPKLRVQKKPHTLWFSSLYKRPLLMNTTGKVYFDKRQRKPEVDAITSLQPKSFVQGASIELYADKGFNQRAKKKSVSSKPIPSKLRLLTKKITERNTCLEKLKQEKISVVERTKLLIKIHNIEELLDFPLHLRYLPENIETLNPGLRKRYKVIKNAKSEHN